MPARPYVLRDPVRREEFLALVRAHPRITKTDLAERMRVSPPTIRNFIAVFERAGLVCSELDPAARVTPRSGAPLVVWIAPKRRPRIGKPKIPHALGFNGTRLRYPEQPYAPTGTPAAAAGRMQVFAIAGRE